MLQSDIMSTYGSTSFTSKCPGAVRWRTLSDGKIEVEGLGVPYADVGGYHGDGAVIRQVWDKYKDFILRASERSGIPARWILALIIIESRGVNHGVNSAGAGGMMGMMLQATGIGLKKVGINRPATKADVADPEMNILAGAGFMRHQADTFGWELPIIAVSHNAGSPKCSPTTRCKSTIDGAWTFDGTNFPNSMGMVEDCTTFNGTVRGSAYALRAVKVNNSAVQMGIGSDGFWLSQDVMLVGVSVASLAVITSVFFPKQTEAAIDFIFGGWLVFTLLLHFRIVRRWDARQVPSHRPGVPDERGGGRRLPGLRLLPDGAPRVPRRARRARRQRPVRGHRPHGPGGRHQLVPPQGRERGVPALQVPPVLHQGQGPPAEARRRAPVQGGEPSGADPRGGVMAKVKRELLQADDMTTTVELISPSRAEELLATNHERQRNMSRAVVDKYIAEMKAGNWITSPHGIVIDSQGHLVDGQHRMEAVRRSCMSFRFVVTRLTADESIRAIDRGSPRTLGNILEMKGIVERGQGGRVSSVAKALYAMTKMRSIQNVKEYESIAERVLDKVGEDIVSVLKSVPRGHKTPSSMIASFVYAYPVNKDLVISTVRRARENDALEHGTGAWHLNKLMTERETKKSPDWTLDMSYRVLHCLELEFIEEKRERLMPTIKRDGVPNTRCLQFFRKKRAELGLGHEVY